VVLDQISAGVDALGVALDGAGREKLAAYLALLKKWNRVHNLTAVREPRKMVSQHLLDCLSVLPYVRGPGVVDVGSGAGLPGIPIAVARSDLKVTLLESSHKKCAFLREAIGELGLANASVASERAQDWRPPALFETVVSRAFADIPEFVAAAAHLVAPGGELLAMKGLYPYEELAQLPEGFALKQVVPLTVPGLDARRHLVILGRTG